ncbi:hypothetical protein GCM10023321_47830 [Pseudonocardia eucalypti]|uniref:UspA domain-containing protein n=1 Tax=Pseudonocardia eucalypti TaxID=648755 RepID=A0ABP9QI52_9PSEU|nr:nucleotide-binding universal stress UspA family protein [Pseudonocardia eucalypti]
MTTRIDARPIVVGVDDTASAHDAALWAADLASAWRAPLCLTHVVNGAGTVSTPELPSWLRELASAAERTGADPVATEVRYGATIDQLHVRSADARMLVLGSYGARGWGGVLAGENAVPLLQRCPCPLVVVRGQTPGVPPRREGPVVVGVDESATGDRALAFAAELAGHSEHRRLLAVHTYSELVRDIGGHAHRLPEDASELARRGHALLTSRLEPLARRHPELTVDSQVVSGTPLRALLAHGHDAWLVVVGQRRAGAPGGPHWGSTSQGLIEFAPCPVAVVPPGATAILEPAKEPTGAGATS